MAVEIFFMTKYPWKNVPEEKEWENMKPQEPRHEKNR